MSDDEKVVVIRERVIRLHFTEKEAELLRDKKARTILCRPVDPPYIFILKKFWRYVTTCGPWHTDN